MEPTEIPAGWCRTTLGEISLSVRETVNPAKEPDLPYIGLEHVERDTGRLLGMGQSADIRSSKLYFEEGDVLYARLRPNQNKIWRATRDGMCSTEFEVFRPYPLRGAFALGRPAGVSESGVIGYTCSPRHLPESSSSASEHFKPPGGFALIAAIQPDRLLPQKRTCKA
jgi:hypothetical protein